LQLSNLKCLGALALVLIAAALARAAAPLAEEEVTRRANALLAQMTLPEKIGQLNQLFVFGNSAGLEADIPKGAFGSFLFVSDPAVINRMQHLAVEKSRLHIPILFGFDVIHGWRTIFPVPIAMAASWDPLMVEQAQTVAAREAYAVGIRWTFAPMVDIARDPRWGRIVEGAGEDPFLGSAMARAQVRGFQGPFAGSPDHLLACVKHFAAYGAGDGGRDYDSAFLSEDSLRNVYLEPYRAAVEAGAASVMSAYMDLNGVPATGNRFLLQDVLRGEWGFHGFVVSDAFSVKSLTTHGFSRDDRDAAFRALTAGVDMDMGGRSYITQVAGLVEDGRLPVATVDNSVRRILAAKIRLGLFENPYVDEARAKQILAAPEHRQLARAAASRSAVLLRNEGQFLPLDKAKLSSIAVIGPLADSPADTTGSWTFANTPAETVAVLQGIRNSVPAGVKVEYARGGEIRRLFPSPIGRAPKTVPATAAEIATEIDQARELALRSDVAVLVLGELQDMSGEAASRATLDLPGRQEELLEAIVATGKPVVLVLISGRPLDLSWASEHVPAILEAWYPGAQGGNAVADLLFGAVNPGGKLPFSWPRSVGQIPVYYAHNLTQTPETARGFTSRYWDQLSSPLYPFGFGLSYTKFAFSNLKLSRTEVPLGQAFEASVDVENTGSRPGDEVVQLYIHQRAGSTSRPVRELKGFERVALAPGEKKTVRFTLDKAKLSYWSTPERKWVQEAETFDVWVGDDATAALHATFQVQ
jgi:beta-glucosidase